MMKRATFSIMVGAVLLVSSNASANLVGTISDGIFSAPSPPCVAPIQCAGVGTNTFSWGDTNSTLQATGSAFNTPLGTLFVMGHLFYSNTVTASGTEVSGVTVTFNSGNLVATQGESLTLRANVPLPLTLTITNTLNTADPIASADYITITSPLFRLDPNQPPVDQFHVFEQASTSVEILGIFGSFLPVGFANIANPAVAFTSSSAPGSSVPGPSSLALLGGGLIALILARQRRS